MTALRSSLAVLAMLALAAVPAAGQENGEAPLPLIPELAPDRDPVDDPSEPPAPPREPAPGDVVVDPLRPVDAEAVGILDGDEGLGAAMWDGTDRVIVERLLPHLPVAAPSPAMRQLMLRLLLTTAAAPSGPPRENLLALRLEQVLALGAFGAVDDLLAVAPRRTDDDRLDRIRLSRLLLAGSIDSACAEVPELLSRHDDHYWQRGLILCQALAGDAANAMLGVELLREEEADDDGFDRLVRAVLDNAAVPDDGIAPTPHNFALLLAAGGDAPAAMLDEASPAMLRVLSENGALPAELRIAAGERASMSGALTAADLSRLYMAVEFPDEVLEDPFAAAEQLGPPLARALRFRTSREQEGQGERAAMLQESWLLAEPALDFAAASRPSAITVLTLSPQPALSFFAPDAVAVLVAAGRREAATAWFALLAEGDDAEAREAAATLAPLMVLGNARRSDDAVARDWFLTLPEDLPDDERIRRTDRMVTLLSGVGHPVDGGLWAALLEAPAPADVASAPVINRLRAAAGDGRVGETVLLALLALGEEGPRAADTITLGAVLDGLKAVDLGTHARALAVEAALDLVR